MSGIDTSSPNTTVFSALLSIAASIWVWGSGALDAERLDAEQARSTEAVEASRRAKALAADCYATTLQIEHVVRSIPVEDRASSPSDTMRAVRLAVREEPATRPSLADVPLAVDATPTTPVGSYDEVPATLSDEVPSDMAPAVDLPLDDEAPEACAPEAMD